MDTLFFSDSTIYFNPIKIEPGMFVPFVESFAFLGSKNKMSLSKGCFKLLLDLVCVGQIHCPNVGKVSCVKQYHYYSVCNSEILLRIVFTV